MNQSEEWTIARLLAWTTDYLEQHGSDSARLDAEVLLGHASSRPRIELYARFNELVDEDVRGQFRELVKQRAAGTPVAYLVGAKEFYSLSFRVTPDVLIPRPDTETIVLEALELLKQAGLANAKVLELGTGSGAIAICLAKYAKCEVTAVDISREALSIAAENATANKVDSQIEWIHGDLYDGLPADASFDLLVTNPPYVSEAEYEGLETSVKEFEPKHALVGGPKGTELIARIVTECGTHLKPGGWLLIELSPMIADACSQLTQAAEGWEQIELLKDLSGHARVLKAKRTG